MIPDLGDLGRGPEDPYTAPEHMRRFYYSYNCGAITVWGTGRAPRTWSRKRIERDGVFPFVEHLTISFDVRHLRALQAIGGNGAEGT